jgi:tRNA 5-methylaminomethyl-2-thiouridine biosynthesis bifunctional protein
VAEPVDWRADGAPHSPRFNDIYRPAGAGLDQARHVFLGGCGLPEAWAGQPHWRILETGFGLGLNFLAAWQAWKDDPQRPGLLHFVSVEAWPVSADDLLRSAACDPQLVPLAQALAAQWFGLAPGWHRLAFEDGRVLLTLCIGDVKDALREQDFAADSVFLDGFDPRRNPQMWELHTLQGVAKLCRTGTRLATWTVTGTVKQELRQCGFEVVRADGLPPKRQCLRGVFAPAWKPRNLRQPNQQAAGDCVVIGAGLAGAAAAASLARRGWRVRVLDAADTPAAGASGLPVGLLTPHTSPDDSLLSRLTRSGVRAAWQQAGRWLREGQDWQPGGVLEHREGATAGLQHGERAPLHAWSRPADGHQLAQAGLPADAPACWHETAGWIKPAALVHAWLSQPGVAFTGSASAAGVRRDGEQWQVLDAGGGELARAQLVVVAAAYASGALLARPPRLQAVRGQVSWAPRPAAAQLPPWPANGSGYFVPDVPLDGASAWLCGSSFDRDDTDASVRAADHEGNLEKLRELLPAAARELEPAFAGGNVSAWAGIRCASIDRRPLLGEIEPGLWLSTAMGSRGLTFAALCGELLAARLHGEPLPLGRKLAGALDTRRHR